MVKSKYQTNYLTLSYETYYSKITYLYLNPITTRKTFTSLYIILQYCIHKLEFLQTNGKIIHVLGIDKHLRDLLMKREVEFWEMLV